MPHHRPAPVEHASDSTSGLAVALLCFLIITIDGFDTTAIGFVAPALAAQWKIAPAALTPAFLLTNVGAVIGYIASGPLVRRLGYRRLILGSLVWFGLFSLATAYADSIAALAVLRLVTALGLGFTVPAAIALTADHAAPGRRTALTVLATTGLSMGGAAGGLIGSALIAHHGWPSIFVFGGIAPLLLVVLLGWTIPAGGAGDEPRRNAQPAPASSPGLRGLLGNGLAARTLLIWAFAFLIFLDTYAFMFWIPTLLLSFGFSAAHSPMGSAAFGFGGVAGNLALLPFVDRYGMTRVLTATSCVTMACLLALGLGGHGSWTVLLLIAGMGIGLVTCCVGQSVLAVTLYGPSLRTTGVGWAAAMGRIGSIVGPGVGGALLALHWDVRNIVLFGCIPALAAIIALLALQRRSQATGGSRLSAELQASD